MRVVFTVGEYTVVSMFLNSAGVQLEAGLSGLPQKLSTILGQFSIAQSPETLRTSVSGTKQVQVTDSTLPTLPSMPALPWRLARHRTHGCSSIAFLLSAK